MKKLLLMTLLASGAVKGSAQCGYISTVAGNGATTGSRIVTGTYSGDGGAATAAGLNGTRGLAFDSSGNMYIADFSNNRIRKVTPSGTITTVAGGAGAGYSGDGGAATDAQIAGPTGICVSRSGDIYFTDYYNSVIRKINTSGIISTFVGTGSTAYSGDGGAATAAELFRPTDIVFDRAGNMYVADGRICIRKISTSGIITTFAGGATAGHSGDGGAATAATFDGIDGIGIDTADNIYVTDNQNFYVRKISASGTVSAVAGVGSPDFTGDGGAATAAALRSPIDVAVDGSGNIYIADYSNQNVRKVTPAGIISTIAGSSAGYSGDGGISRDAQLRFPYSLAFDVAGNLYIADAGNYRIRKISTTTYTPTVSAISGASTVNTGSSTTYTNSVTGGTWSTSNTSIATVSGSGDVYGVNAGTATISYTISDVCGTARATKNITVVNAHAPVFTTASPSLKGSCKDKVTNLNPNMAVSDLDAGQTLTWTLQRAPAHGTANVTGTAISTGGTVLPTGRTYTPATGYTGTDTFIVRISDGSAFSDMLVIMTIVPLPATPTISGPSAVCTNDSITLSGSPTGGVFNSGGGGILARPSGIVKGLAAGTYTVTYSTLPNSYGCNSSQTKVINVKKPLSLSSITGPASACTGTSITLRNDTTGGTWGITNPALATVSGGIMYPIGAGIDTVTYTYTNACGTKVATRRIIITLTPNAGTITGADSVLVGGYITLARTTTMAGTWSSSDNTIASVSTTGSVRGNSVGVDTIRYTVTNSCGTAIARKTIRVMSFGSKSSSEGTEVWSNNGTATGNSLKVWPNPSEGTVNLELPEDGAVIAVLDVTGRTVYTGNTTEGTTSLNLGELPAGTYMLRVVCGGKVYAERVVIE